MATSDSYNSPYPGQRRVEAPLPPLPPLPSSASAYPNHHHHQFSTLTSSPDDPVNRAGGRRSDQTLGLNNEYYRPGRENPFEDPTHYSDDIPLRQNPRNGNAALSSPYSPQHDSNGIENMEGRDHRQDRVPKKKSRFLNKRIPWAVYSFTAIQIVVFLAELIKNGKQRPTMSSK